MSALAVSSNVAHQSVRSLSSNKSIQDLHGETVKKIVVKMEHALGMLSKSLIFVF